MKNLNKIFDKKVHRRLHEDIQGKLTGQLSWAAYSPLWDNLRTPLYNLLIDETDDSISNQLIVDTYEKYN